MKKINLISYASLVLLLSTFAAPSFSQTTALSDVRKIGRVDVRANGTFDIHTEDDTSWNVAGDCVNANHARVLGDHTAHDEIYSLVLAAKHSDREIFLRATCNAGDTGAVIYVTEIFER